MDGFKVCVRCNRAKHVMEFRRNVSKRCKVCHAVMWAHDFQAEKRSAAMGVDTSAVNPHNVLRIKKGPAVA